ncbi:MAG: sugar phosphate isomerase/epimerase, partial [Ignavibacteriales bacterium]|nr:sugar phosphate isomerase/epimerase [Ignavibacteriales bacterium]
MLQTFEVTIPPLEIEKNIGILVRNRLGAELMLYDPEFTRNSKPGLFENIGELLRGHGIVPTVHGPFYDLNPGSKDSAVRGYTLKCFSETLDASSRLGARLVVLHTGLNPLLPIHFQEEWLERSVCSWKIITGEAEKRKLPVAIENTFAPDSSTIESIAAGVSSEWLKVCFDPAHVHVYSKKTVGEWLDRLDGMVAEVHLNDNSGDYDDHLPLGEGTVDFED